MERRAAIRVFFVDEELNVLHGSEIGATLPRELRRIVTQFLLPGFNSQAKKSHAVATSEGRVVRLISVPAKKPMFAIVVELLGSRASLQNAIKEFKFSAREVDVLLLALEGCTAAESAERLDLRTSTVNDYLNRLLWKTGARNKTALIAKVLGWHAPDSI